MSELELLSAFSLGLAGAGHCLGMCGGIAAALNLGSQTRTSTTIAYHSGRILSYTLLGGLLGSASAVINIGEFTLLLRYIAGVLLIAMGLYIANWWRGMEILERAGARLWRPVQKWSSRWLPIRHWRHALALGLCWGLMPCGLIYSSLAWAATSGDGVTSALLMLAFGLGTLPAMLATSLGATQLQALLRKRGLKILIALLLIVSGCWTLYVTASHSGHAGHGQANSNEHSDMDHSKH